MIIAKILVNNQIKIIRVSQENYILIEQNFKIGTKQFLQQNGYQSGKFNITYYSVKENKIFDKKFKITQLSSDKKQCKCIIDQPVLKNILQYQEQIDERIEYIRFIGLSQSKLTQFDYIKYNQFKQQFILKSQDKIQLNKEQQFYIYETQYEPVSQIFILTKKIQQNDEIQYIQLGEPYFYQIEQTTTQTEYLTLNDLFNTSSNAKINKQLSISNMKQTIYYDYTKPENFIHFGTYTSRLNALILKHKKLCYYSNSNMTYLQQYGNIIKNFNTFQRQNFINNLAITTQNNLHYQLINTNSVEYGVWTKSIYITASNYDSENIHTLTNLLPRAIYENSNNQDLITLVNLMGDMFDQYWSAIKLIPSLSSKLQTQLEQFNQQLLKDILKNTGQQFIKSFNNQQLKSLYLNYPKSSITTKLSFDKYNKILLSRLIANMPFLLRMKGTRSCLEQILNIFGFSQSLIRITQFMKDDGTGSMKFKKIMPAYIGQLLINNINETNGIIVYFRPLTDNYSFKLNGSIMIQNSETDKIIPNNQYCMMIHSNSVELYNQNNKLDDDLLTISCSDVTSITINSHQTITHYIDSVKLLNESQHIINYINGKNSIYDIEQVDFIFDGNDYNPIKLNKNSNVVTINPSQFDIIEFDSFEYSQIFNVANTPSKFYSITSSDWDETVITKFDSSSNKNLSSIHIGGFYSDNYNSKFISDYNNNFNNLLDNLQCDNNLTYYPELQQYKKQYNNQYNESTLVSYNSMSCFYQGLDTTLFSTIEQFIPTNVNYTYGLILDNNILTRNKIPSIQMNDSVTKKINLQKIKLQSMRIEPNISQKNYGKYKYIYSNMLFGKMNNQISSIINSKFILSKVESTINNPIKMVKIKLEPIINIYGIDKDKDTTIIKTFVNQFTRINRKETSYGEIIFTQSVSAERNMIITQDQELSMTKIKI